MTPGNKGSGGDDNVRIFSVETRFQKLAMRPGGIPRDKAIAKATAGLGELRPELDKWISEQAEALRNALPTVGAARDDSDWIANASIYAGRLRDVGTTAGYELVTFVAGSMCEILESSDATTERGVDSLNCHFDALQLVRKPQYYRLRPEDLPELKQGLLRVVATMAPREVNDN